MAPLGAEYCCPFVGLFGKSSAAMLSPQVDGHPLRRGAVVVVDEQPPAIRAPPQLPDHGRRRRRQSNERPRAGRNPAGPVAKIQDLRCRVPIRIAREPDGGCTRIRCSVRDPVIPHYPTTTTRYPAPRFGL